MINVILQLVLMLSHALLSRVVMYLSLTSAAVISWHLVDIVTLGCQR